MKKALVIISILAVFAVLGVSVAALPIFDSNTDISLGLKDLDELSPEVQALIDHDVEEALQEIEAEKEAQATPQSSEVVVEESSDDTLAMAMTESATLGQVTCKIEPRGDGNYIVGYTAISGTNPSLTLNSATSLNIVGIAEGAFKGCKELKAVDLSGSAIKNIGMSAFYGCTSLDTVTFPAGIEKIGGYAFINTPWLKKARADANASSLKNRLVIVNGILIDGIAAEGEVVAKSANGINEISPYAFSYNSKMTKLTIDSIPVVPYRLCSSATGLEELKVINVNTLSPFSFFDCESLTKVTLDGVSIIDRAAFYSCYKLATIEFGDVLTRINNNAFMDCYALEELTFPSTLVEIDVSGFLNCKGITKLTFLGTSSDGTAGYIFLGQGAFQNCTKLDVVTLDPDDSTKLKNLKTNGVQFKYTDATRTTGSKKITFFGTKVEIPD